MSDSVVVPFTGRPRRRRRNRGPYADAESCAAMMIACTAAAGGAPSDLVRASSDFMQRLVEGLRETAADHDTFTLDVDVDGVTITIGFDGSDMFVDEPPTTTQASRMAAAAFDAVLHQWAIDHLPAAKHG